MEKIHTLAFIKPDRRPQEKYKIQSNIRGHQRGMLDYPQCVFDLTALNIFVFLIALVCLKD